MEGQTLNYQEQNQLGMIPTSPSYVENRSDQCNQLESQITSQMMNPENNSKLQGLVSTNSKSPITQVGNVALTKGMYLALMKRREQIAFGDLNYSSTPRLRASTANAPSRQYKSCVRVLSDNSDQGLTRRKRLEWPNTNTTPLRQKNQQKAYQDIHKTKKIKKSVNGIKNKPEKQQKNQSPMFLTDITKNCLNDSQNQSNMLTRRGKKQQLLENNETFQEKTQGQAVEKMKQEKYKSEKQGNTKENCSVFTKGISTMKSRSKVISKQDKNKEKQLKQRKITRNITSNSSDKENNNNNNSLDTSKQPLNSKENQLKAASNNRKKQLKDDIYKSNNDSSQVLTDNSSKNSNQNGLKELKFSHIWHEESADLATERATFIQKLRRDKKKKYSSSPKRLVPGFKVKFETSRHQIFAFNCFRDKDLEISKEYRPTIDIQQDNDFDTDSEQLKESVYNVFQSLCVAVCEEKISHQIRNQQTQSSIY